MFQIEVLHYFHVNWSASKVNSFLKDSRQYKGSFFKYVRKISRKTNILTPCYVDVRVRIRGLEMLVFRKILCTYLMDRP